MPKATKTKIANDVELSWYVLFGYNTEDVDQTGYFTKSLEISNDIESALKLPSVNVNQIPGFGTPQQWKDLINADSDLNHGFKFHLVKTKLSA